MPVDGARVREQLVDHLPLVVITDDVRDGPDGLVARCGAAVRGGATMVQLRLKRLTARELVETARLLVQALPVPVIVNDRTDVALAAGAAGVHLGIDDLSVGGIRAIAPAGFIIGASLGSEAELSHADGADYVGIGPIATTTSKVDAGDAIGDEGFARLCAYTPAPAVAIGGVDVSNVAALRVAGAAGVAVIRAVLSTADPELAAHRLREAFDGR